MENDASSPQLHAALQNILDQLHGAWRFRWVALITAWCTAVVLWTGCFLIPNTYQSSAQVFVNTRTTLSEATEGLSLGDDIDSQIERVRQALLGDPQLLKVAEETNLMAGAITPQEQQQVIENLGNNIDVSAESPDLTKKPNQSNRPITTLLVTISYKDHNLSRSLQVVSRLLNDFVEGSLGQEGSEQAQQFLKNQIAEYGQRLSASEQRLADFKKHNVGLLPGDKGDYFTRLQQETGALTQTRENLALAERKLEQIQKQLRGGQQFTSGATGVGPIANPAALDTEDQIAQTQQRLNQLLLSYTDQYPGVIALRQSLKELKARQKAEIAAAKKGDLGAAADLHLAANPVYQKLQEQYNDEQVEIASLRQDVVDRERGIVELKSMMSAAPQVQAQYTQLTRDYNVTRKQYNELLVRLDSARLGQQAASTGIVKFDIVNPPTAQYKPISPNRPEFIVVSLLIALGIGVGVAYLLHLLRPVFVSARQLSAVTGLTVLGSVGTAWLDRHIATRRRSQVVYACWAAGLLVLAGGLLLKALVLT